MVGNGLGARRPERSDEGIMVDGGLSGGLCGQPCRAAARRPAATTAVSLSSLAPNEQRCNGKSVGCAKFY